MPDFQKGPNFRTPFGPNEFLRSTQDVKTESYTVAKGSVTAETIDGAADQKVLQRGEVMAKITSGGDAGKVGPFQADATDGRQTLANIVGLNATFLPYQLMDRDVEIGVVVQATAVQAWCFERNTAGARIALTNTTADAMRGGKRLHVNFA